DDLRDPHSFPTRRSSDLSDHACVKMKGCAKAFIFAFPIVIPSFHLLHITQYGEKAIVGIHFFVALTQSVQDVYIGIFAHITLKLDRKSTRLNSTHVKMSY